MKVLNFEEPIYQAKLRLIFDCKASEAEAYLINNNIVNRSELRRCSGQTGSYIIKKPENWRTFYFMYLEKGREKESLLHEVSHLVFFILEDCGIHITQQTDEMYSYYLEWWYKKLAKILKI